MLVRKQIMNNTYFNDAEVPLTLQLLKTVVKRAWTRKDGNINRPSLLHAMDRLTPFAMLDLNEDQVSFLNDEQDLLTKASLVSVDDLRGHRNKMKISIPTKAEEFMLMLKRYANLLYVIFTETCTFFKALVKVIRALKEYSREARKKMSLATKG